MFFTRSLFEDTKSEAIFDAVKECFKEKNISLENNMSVSTHGAPAIAD